MFYKGAKSRTAVGLAVMLVVVATLAGLTRVAFTSDTRPEHVMPSSSDAMRPLPDRSAEAAAGTACGDVNASGAVNSADIISLVNYVFKGGAEPTCPSCVMADGGVNPDGTVFNIGTDNWTAKWDTFYRYYRITIKGETYDYANFHTTVTNLGMVGLRSVSTASASGDLLVYLYDATGAQVQGFFSFSIIRF